MYPNAGAPRVLGGAVSRQQASFSMYRDIAATDIVPLLQFPFPLFCEKIKCTLKNFKNICDRFTSEIVL